MADMLTAEQAYNVLVTSVHAPVFFRKLASVYSIEPQNEEDAQELLRMAADLRNAHNQSTQKQARANGSLIKQARQALQAQLQKEGYSPLPVNSSQLQKEASEAARSPLLQEAALVFQSYLAQSAAS